MTEATAKKSKALSAGWSCFSIGVAIMLLIHTSILFSGPFFLAAFVLSIVGITQNRIGSGVVLLILSLIVPPAIFIGTIALSYESSITEIETKRLREENEKKAALRSISFEDVNGELGRSYMEIEGKVRNNGNRKVDYVKVGVEWLDKNGKVVDTDWTYAVSSEGLRPGGAKSFRVSTRLDKRAERFRYYILED